MKTKRYGGDEQYDALVAALLGDDLNAARQILASGMNINAGNNFGWTPLHFTVEHMRPGSIRFLLENGANPNQKDAAGWTPLHLAIDVEMDVGNDVYVRTGVRPASADLTGLLLEYGADPNVKTGDGKRPLGIAKHHPKAIELLTRHGARET